jgi:hypothetical protein
LSLATPDKTQLPALRILDILALAYLLLSSVWLRSFAGRRIFRPLEVCGRHSLEVFAVGCTVALFGRLLFRTYGAGLVTQIAINVIGVAMIRPARPRSASKTIEDLARPRTPSGQRIRPQARNDASAMLLVMVRTVECFPVCMRPCC